jgi:hypothetical protein
MSQWKMGQRDNPTVGQSTMGQSTNDTKDIGTMDTGTAGNGTMDNGTVWATGAMRQWTLLGSGTI